MIDILIMGGTYLYSKLKHGSGGGPDKVIELAQICDDEFHKVQTSMHQAASVLSRHEDKILIIQKELKGLVPASVNSELAAISRWMEEHVSSEQQTLRKLVKDQLYWNMSLACVAGLALLLSIVALFK